MHARFAVEWFFNHVLEKKSLQEKNCMFLIREEKKLCFVVGRKKDLVRKKKHTLPLVSNSPSLIDYRKSNRSDTIDIYYL